MFISILTQAPLVALVWLVVILLSLSAHEFSHALLGHLKGDETAQRAGRLTLNPLAHIDPMGFVLLLLMGFGWAKPVPFNPYNLKHPRRDALHIALAGPGSNLLIAVVSGLILRFLLAYQVIAPNNLLAIFLLLMVVINLFLMIFNLIPLDPLDGSKLLDVLLYRPDQQALRQTITKIGPQVLLVLVVLSIFTSINVFFFVSAPSFFLCDAIVGTSCDVLFARAF